MPRLCSLVTICVPNFIPIRWVVFAWQSNKHILSHIIVCSKIISLRIRPPACLLLACYIRHLVCRVYNPGVPARMRHGPLRRRGGLRPLWGHRHHPVRCLPRVCCEEVSCIKFFFKEVPISYYVVMIGARLACICFNGVKPWILIITGPWDRTATVVQTGN